MINSIKPFAIVRFSLAFVAFYFGVSELLNPARWTSFVPPFLGTAHAETLVLVHGVILCAIGLSLVTKFYHRIAALVFCGMLAQIIVGLIGGNGLNPTAARDIGLFGTALAVALSKNEA